MNRRVLLAGLFAALAGVISEPVEAARKRARRSKSGSRRSKGQRSFARSGGGGSSYYPNCASARAAGAAPVFI